MEWVIEIAKQIPSLAALIWLVVQFTQTITKISANNAEISKHEREAFLSTIDRIKDDCHEVHNRSLETISDSTRAISRIETVMEYVVSALISSQGSSPATEQLKERVKDWKKQHQVKSGT